MEGTVEELEEKINGIKLNEDDGGEGGEGKGDEGGEGGAKGEEEDEEELGNEKEETEKDTGKISNRAMKLQKNKNKRDGKKKNKQNAKSKKEKTDNTMNDSNNVNENGKEETALKAENKENKETNEKTANIVTDVANTNENENDKVILPVMVEYCKICSMPYEYCEYGKFYDECREENKDKYNYDTSSIVIDLDVKKKMKRPEKPTNTKITIQKTSRAKKKVVTVVTGLHAYVKLEKMSKIFSKTFACGASVIKGTNNFPDHVDIQGDVGSSVMEVIMKNCPEITEDKFVFLAPK